MIFTPVDVLAPSISTGGVIPPLEECRAIIAQVSKIEYLIELFLTEAIDADDYLDGVNDVEGLDTDQYIEGLTLWLPML